MRSFLSFRHPGLDPESSKKQIKLIWMPGRGRHGGIQRIYFCLVLLLTAGLLLFAPKASADVKDFVINDFQGRYELFNDTHAGRLQVTETIQVTFSDQNHGILRAIPTDYRGHSVRLDVESVKRDGDHEGYTTYRQANNEVLKIGNAEKTITGPHTYEIRYQLKNVIAFFDDHDEWYWDINGDQWDQPFQKVRGEVIMPHGWNDEGLSTPSCYTGKFGSTNAFCDITRTSSGYTFSSRQQLGPRETLTVATPFQKGLFTPRDRTDWYRDNVWQLAGLATAVAFSLVAFGQWWRWGKDYKGSGIVVPEYKPPKDLTPAEVGLLNDYRVDSRDLSATIIDLAIRGYIKIHDEEKKRFGLFKSHKFSLELANENTGPLKAHEKTLLKALFKQMVKGTTQDLSTINKAEVQSAVGTIRSSLKKSLTHHYGLLEEKPTSALITLWGIGILFAIILISVPTGWGWKLGAVIACASALISGLLLRRRSHAGVKMYEHIKGLELYMKTAEKDRLKMMESVDRPYAEPSHTVEFFEKLLPFAVALGVENSWAKQFENIYREPPGWYSGNYATFNAVYFTHSLASGVSAFNSSFSTSTSSSGSGSGGGGSAGGGGGGGGGGGW
jgi:uncharacterized membrane protein YgcG